MIFWKGPPLSSTAGLGYLNLTLAGLNRWLPERPYATIQNLSDFSMSGYAQTYTHICRYVYTYENIKIRPSGKFSYRKTIFLIYRWAGKKRALSINHPCGIKIVIRFKLFLHHSVYRSMFKALLLASSVSFGFEFAFLGGCLDRNTFN